jgi:pimeloyl-ACP methyl ester carboxylesterase
VGLTTLAGAVTTPAWKTKPSFYLVSKDDQLIPPPAQRMMAARAGATVVETAGSHALHVSHPEAVVDLIERSANGS